MKNTLRQFREEAALSQLALAEEVGVTRQCIIALEQGKWSPNLDLAYRLADVLGTRVETLFPPPGEVQDRRKGEKSAGREGEGEDEDGRLETWLL